MSRSQKLFGLAWLLLVAVTVLGRGFVDPLRLPNDFREWACISRIDSDSGSHRVYINSNRKKVVVVFQDAVSKKETYTVMVHDDDLFATNEGWGTARFDQAQN